MSARLFSILISSLILTQSFNIHINDLLKLNDLIEHAKFHEAKYGDDIFTFLSKHYGELKGKHSENHQNEDNNQLPFDSNCSFDTFTAFVLYKNSLSVEESKPIVVLNSIFFYQETTSSYEKPDVFQPPRRA